MRILFWTCRKRVLLRDVLDAMPVLHKKPQRRDGARKQPEQKNISRDIRKRNLSLGSGSQHQPRLLWQTLSRRHHSRSILRPHHRKPSGPRGDNGGQVHKDNPRVHPTGNSVKNSTVLPYSFGTTFSILVPREPFISIAAEENSAS